MTTFSREQVRCALCGNTQEAATLMSTNSFGVPDLDLRPPPMRRNTMNVWLQECERCHYAAPDLAKPRAGGAEMVRSAAYLAEHASTARPRLATRFVCASLIAEAAGDIEDAAWQRVRAAWVCDDERLADQASAQRTRALELFDRLPAATGSKRLDRMAVCVDLARRSGQFGRAFALAVEGQELAGPGAETPHRAIFEFQARLSQAGDGTCHKVDEAIS